MYNRFESLLLMKEKPAPPLSSTIQKIAATRPASWVFARILPPIDRAFNRLIGRRMTITGSMTGLPVVIVTTTGAKSGLPRQSPLFYISDDSDPQRFALIASNFGQEHNPAWYYNLKAHPRAKCSIAGVERDYLAHEASGEEYERFWQAACKLYRGYSLYKERAKGRKIPILVMEPLRIVVE
jgi:deazaflavin-dependent oxidoreductase (nitroreductase family)